MISFVQIPRGGLLTRKVPLNAARVLLFAATLYAITVVLDHAGFVGSRNWNEARDGFVF